MYKIGNLIIGVANGISAAGCIKEFRKSYNKKEKAIAAIFAAANIMGVLINAKQFLDGNFLPVDTDDEDETEATE